jgi:hypothetical protein
MNLPDKASALIRLALSDLEKTEKDINYRINMRVWHDYQLAGEVCEVCLAGCVISQTLNVGKCISTTPESFDESTYKKLVALNKFRVGSVDNAFWSLSPTIFLEETVARFKHYNRTIRPYLDNPVIFKQDMNQLADDLERDGY